MSAFARDAVSIASYSRCSQASSIASARPLAWKHAVGSPYSAAYQDSKYDASATVGTRAEQPHRVGVLLVAAHEVSGRVPCSTPRRSPVVRPMR